jgi:hypothetical protein
MDRANDFLGPHMDKKTIFAGLLPLGLISLPALGIWLFQTAGNLRGTTNGALYLRRHLLRCSVI